MSVKDKVAIITGAGSGQGRSAAELFTQNGAKVVIADYDEKAGNETVEIVKKAGGEAVFFKTNVADEDNVKALVEFTVKTYGDLDILYNNAGITMNPERPIEDVDREAWDRVIAVDLTGPFLATKYALPIFKAKKSGVIINTSSTSGVHPRANCSAYAAAKAGVIGFTKQLAVEVGSYNIRANAIVPGPVFTTMMKARMQELGPEKAEQMKNMIIGDLPYGDRMIYPEDIAQTALFLASDSASMITGVALNVDAGFCI